MGLTKIPLVVAVVCALLGPGQADSKDASAPKSASNLKKSADKSGGSDEKLDTASQSLFGYNNGGGSGPYSPNTGGGGGGSGGNAGFIGGGFGGQSGNNLGSGVYPGQFTSSLGGPGSSAFAGAGGPGSSGFSGGPGFGSSGFSGGPGSSTFSGSSGFSGGPGSSTFSTLGGYGGQGQGNAGFGGFGGGYTPAFGQGGGFGYYPGGNSLGVSGNGGYLGQNGYFGGGNAGFPGSSSGGFGGFGGSPFSSSGFGGGFNSYPQFGFSNPQLQGLQGQGQSERNLGFVNQAFGNPIYNRSPAVSSGQSGLGSLQVGSRLDVSNGNRGFNYLPSGGPGGFSTNPGTSASPSQFDSFGLGPQSGFGGGSGGFSGLGGPQYSPASYNSFGGIGGRPQFGSIQGGVLRPGLGGPFDYRTNIGLRSPGPSSSSGRSGGSSGTAGGLQTSGPNRFYQGASPAGSFGRDSRVHRFTSPDDETDT